MNETKVTNDQWAILPLIDPVVSQCTWIISPILKSILCDQVTKSEVDSYLIGKRIPHCELVVRPLCEPPTKLVHQILLSGARPPQNKFTLSYMPPPVNKGISI